MKHLGPKYWSRAFMRCGVALVGCGVLLAVGCGDPQAGTIEGAAVVQAAYAYRDGGGTNLDGPGTPRKIEHHGVRILPQDPQGTHCVGYTFTVFCDVASQAGPLGSMYVEDLKALQQDWFCATELSRLKGCVYAIEKWRVGREVPLAQAEPGDFLQIQRSTTGHQAIFLDWVRNASGHVVGIRYRGSQGSTQGIGDAEEFFASSGLAGAELQVDRVFVGRLSRAAQSE